MQPRRAVQWLGGITALALAVRLWDLGGPTLWTDEMYTFNVASRSLAGVLSDRDQTPPLFTVFLHFWMKLAGTSEFALRLPSALAGAATVPVLHQVAKRYLSTRDALVVAALAALHYYLSILSMDLRAYAFFVLLGAASILTCLRLQERWTAGRVAAHVAITVLLLYSHSYAVFVVAAQALDTLWVRRRRDLARWLAAYGGIGLLFVPWLPVLLGGAQRVAQGFWIEAPGWDDLYWTRVLVSGGRVAGILVPLAAALSLFPRPAAGRAPGLRLLWLWLLLAVAVPYLVSFRFPIFTPRYAVAGFLPLAILAVRGLGAMRGAWRPWTTAALVVALAGQLAFSLAAGHPDNAKQDWSGAIQLVESQAPPGSSVVFSKGYCDSATDLDLACPWERYAARRDLRLAPFFFEDRGVSLPVNATTVQRLDGLVRGAPEAWLLYSYPSDGSHLAHARLEGQGWTLLGEWHLKGIDLWRYAAPTGALPPGNRNLV